MHIAIIALTFQNAGCAGSKKKYKADIELFDSIVDQVLDTNGYKNPKQFSFQRIDEGQQRHYVVNYLMEQTQEKPNAHEHWILTISVAEAGDFIDIAKYEANEKTHPTVLKPAYAKRYIDVDFINIPTSYAPSGLFSGMAATTLDEKFDIRIMVSNLLPGDVQPPEIDFDRIGKMIFDSYVLKSSS
jgi:hypothetical protein